jgi:hypothetical protein
MGFMKNLRFREHFDVRFRGEFFNIFNHPNPSSPCANLSVPSTFGKTTSFSAARVILFGLKLAF